VLQDRTFSTEEDVSHNLKGRVALVTGASRGLGAAIAEQLAEAGANVAVGCGHAATTAEEVVKQLVASGRTATTVRGDVEDPVEVEKMVGATEAELGLIDILVSNASIASQQHLEVVRV
jgi:NAD(P)-dependent dehydrogenase (short-subunit alcohol dehydrogenase family)